MWYIIAFVALFFVGFIDGHFSSVIAMCLMFFLGIWSVNSINNKDARISGGKVFGVIFTVYTISALIASQSFVNGQFFYVSDSMKYIEKYGDVNTWSGEDALFSLAQALLFFDDSNGLFNVCFTFWSYIANHYSDGASVFYLTLFQTIFGVLTSLEIYKIFLIYFTPSRASKYVCVFVFLSLFHIYSILIIRDIVIAFFYMLGVRKVIGKPQITDIFVLLIVMIVTIGIRLYTGLFFGAFILFWLYKLLQDEKYVRYKIILAPIIVVGIAYVVVLLASSVLIENTAGQIEHYDDIYADESGFSSKFRSMPIGIRHVVILFFSQLPLEDTHRFSISSSFSNYYLTFLAIIYKIFGFVIFYGLIYYYFLKGFFKKLDINENILLIIMFIFIALTLSTHIDVRRSMEAIPFLFLFYMLASEQYSRAKRLKVNKILVTSGVLMMIAYAIVK